MVQITWANDENMLAEVARRFFARVTRGTGSIMDSRGNQGRVNRQRVGRVVFAVLLGAI